MDSDANSKDDVKLPDNELGRQIEADFEAGKDLRRFWPERKTRVVIEN
jgi:hypothetical protein